MDNILLDKLCRQYAPAEYAADDFSEVAVILKSTLVPVPSQKAWTYSDLMAIPEIGMDGVRIVISTINSADAVDPLMGPTHTALSTEGMLLNSPERQAMIQQLATPGYGDWETLKPGLTSAVMQAGVAQIPAWKYHGLEAEPTETDCTNAKVEKAALDLEAAQEANRQVLASNASIALSAVMDLIESEDGSTTPVAMAAAFSTAIGA